MSKVKILVGLPSSGKTTYARYCEKYLKCVMVSQDELYQIPSPLNVRSRIVLAIIEAANDGKDVVVDGTYINRYKRKEIVTLARELGAEVEMCVFDKTVEECIERNESKKDRYKPTEDAIKEMYKLYQAPTESEYDTLTVIDTKWEEDHSKRIKTIIDNDDKYMKLLVKTINESKRNSHVVRTISGAI